VSAGRPPCLAEWLLRRTLPPGARGESILGDLVEDWHGFGETAAATLTFWRHAVSLAARYFWRRDRTYRPHPAATRGGHMFLDNFRNDLRYAIRSYAKAPSFTFIILTTLALGIGASTAIFSMVNGILLRPLPLHDPDRLLYVTEVNPKGTVMTVSWPNYLDWRARSQSFELLACSREESYTLTGTDRAQRLTGRRVTGSFFRVLGVSPATGRGFTDDDDRPNAAALAMLSDAYWRTKLGADPNVVGRTLTLDGRLHTVVGVLPRDFEYIRPYDLFTSMGPSSGSGELLDRGNHNGFYALGRLKPGVTVEGATSELRTIAAALEREYPNTNSGVTIRAERLADRLVEDVRLTLLALFGAVGFLLLIACVNVANLLVARGAARQHELAVRAALGGGRSRLAGQLLVESTIISVAGGALGVVVAAWLLQALVAAAPEGIPRITDVRLDGATLLFALVSAAFCGIAFGALPALQASGVGGQHALVRGRAAGFAARSHRLRRGLMVVETALALLLLTGAGLMMRTLHELTQVETGFKPDHLLTTRFVLAGEQWTRDKRAVFFDDVLTRVRTLPGVTSAALAFSLPIDGSNWNSIFIVGDKPVPPRAQLPSAAFTPVSAGYFETMGMRLVRGRFFNAADTTTAPKVTVVNESLAKRLWPGEDAVGKRLKQGWPENPNAWRELVGVVADVKFNGVTADMPMQSYLPLAQEPSRGVAIVARSAGDPAALGLAIEGVMQQLNKELPLYEIRTMDEMLGDSIARQRLSMLVFVMFAAVALTLASVGLYGVVAHGVTERMHEIGVRIALGAEQRHVLGMVIRQGLSMALIGTAIGVGGALALSQWIQSLLFGVRATDPATIGAVVAMLLTVAVVACSVPAWRATRVDPTTALRAE
jgi:putative ABC transport system permease protein